jgi:hypothetical protein
VAGVAARKLNFSLAHTDQDIDRTIEIAIAALGAIA